MKTTTYSFVCIGLFFSFFSYAQTADFKVKDLSANDDTTIRIEKGRRRCDCETHQEPDYEIVAGDEGIVGDPSNIEDIARSNWKTACEEWKKGIKDLNKDNSIVILSCGIPNKLKESFNISFNSKGIYKMRVRIRDLKTTGALNKK